MNIEQFFAEFKPLAIADMKSSKILASLTGAQGFIESRHGDSDLTKKANNLFGMKGRYNGQSIKMWTTEYYNGVAQKVMADFRMYPDWQASVNDHSSLFNRLDRYKNLRGLTDYRLACKYVAQDGYATSPSYEQTLLSCIIKYQLYRWDEEVLGESPGETYVKNLPVLKKGSRGDYVLAWQKMLNLNGYFCGAEDGIFGINTERAVKEWQTSHGLDPDGVIGKQTWASIGL